MRKGQTTLYIIIAILVLIAIGIVLYLFAVREEQAPTPQLETPDIEFMIEDCIRLVGIEGLEILGQNENYIHVQEENAIPELLRVNDTSYWIYEYSNVMPVFNSSADEFKTWFNKNFLECVDYTPFIGYSISTGAPESQIDYGGETVVINLNYPINITRGDQVKRLDFFQKELNIRYRRVFERGMEIVNGHYSEFFDYNRALFLVDKRDFNISYEINDENNLVFLIKDPFYVEGAEPYEFRFATNLNRSFLKRTAKVDPESLAFIYPYVLSSPDRMAKLYLLPGVTVNQNELSVHQEYFTEASREVVSRVSYTIKGGIKPGSQQSEIIKWNLTYPIYHFNPNGTEFNFPQRLVLFWDDDKIPNTGPMGILYRGPGSEGEWMPLMSRADYRNNLVYTLIPGFSEYTALDCNKQSCKSVSVKSTNKPKKAFLCMLQAILKAILIILIIIIIAACILCWPCCVAAFKAVTAFFTGGATAAGSAGAASLAASAGVAAGTGSVGLAGLSFSVTAVGASGVTGVAGAAAAFTNFVITMYVVTALAFVGGTVGGSYLGADAYESGETFVTFTPTCDQIIEVTCTGSGKLSSGSGNLNGETVGKGETKEFTVKAGEPQRLGAMAEKCKKKKYKCYSCSITCTAVYK